MTPLFLDSSVLLYALGGPSDSKHACVALVDAAASRRCVFHLSVEAIQEVVFHRMRMQSREDALEVGRSLSALAVLHPFDEDVLRRSLQLIETSAIRGRDAVHAATALAQGFDAIICVDRDFAAAPGLEVVQPVQALARL